MSIKADPIKLSKARKDIRAAQVRLSGIEKIADYTGRVTMYPEDKHAIMEVLNNLHEDADKELEKAIEYEAELLKRPEPESA